VPIIRLQHSGDELRIGTTVQRRGIPRRSRHLPLASTEGSRTENLNKTGVRLWTDSSLVATLVEPAI
jgi:hypothetical protein